MLTNKASQIIKKCNLNDPAKQELIDKLEKDATLKLPQDYIQLMMWSNGIEGFISQNQYLVLWQVEKIFKLNEGYHSSEFVPGLLLIGSNGGGTSYAFDTRDDSFSVVSVPFILMSFDNVEIKGKTISEFIENMSK